MDLERLLLSKLTTKDEISLCWDQGLRPETFVDIIHGRIFDFIVRYWRESSLISAPTHDVLKYEFPHFSPVKDVEETTSWLIDAIKRRYASNKLQNVLRSAAKDSVDEPIAALDNLFKESWDVKNSLSKRVARSDLSQNITERAARYTDTMESPEVGAPTGFDDIDQHTKGLRAGELAAVAAYTKVGKSWTLIHSALSARKAGFTPFVATLEMSVPEFEDRFDALNSGVSYSRLQSRKLYKDELKQLSTSREELAELGHLYVEQPERGARSVQDIVGRARQLGCDYILIDQLSFMDSHKDYMSKTDKYSEIIHDLKEEIAASERGLIPCFLAVQFNRNSVAEAGKRGTINHIAYSSAIEQTVDIAYGLYTNKELKVNNSMIIDILASRRSVPKSWLLEWQLQERSVFGVRKELEDE